MIDRPKLRLLTSADDSGILRVEAEHSRTPGLAVKEAALVPPTIHVTQVDWAGALAKLCTTDRHCICR